MKQFLLFLLLLFSFSSVKSQNYDSFRVSLLTESPRPTAVWTIFGHTALRLYDPDRDIDAVLNWGTFDMEQPNFIWRFVEGKTDYFLGAAPFEYYIMHCNYNGVKSTEQVLNIPDSEKEALLEFLQTNLLPENINYRYNFIFDNCTTRPRDIIERFCGGTMIYPKQTQPVTLRQLIHQYTRYYPWLELGIDCVIGSGADSLVSFRYELFLPEKLMDALERSAVKLADGSEQPVVLSSSLLFQSPDYQLPTVNHFIWNNTFVTGFVIFILYLFLVIAVYFKKQRPQLPLDFLLFTTGVGVPKILLILFRLLPFALLFFVAGAGGCIVAMLNFFSLHPCVQSNWNILWLHPLHFIAFAGFFFRKSYQWIRWYHTVNFVLLSCFLLGWHWIPQELNKTFIPLILCLWVVSGLQTVVLKAKKI